MPHNSTIRTDATRCAHVCKFVDTAHSYVRTSIGSTVQAVNHAFSPGGDSAVPLRCNLSSFLVHDETLYLLAARGFPLRRCKCGELRRTVRAGELSRRPSNSAWRPKTAALFEAVDHDAERVAKGGKHFFSRARPFIASRDVQPIVPKRPGDDYNSYPSGHATFGYLCAILLAQMVPEKRDALFAREREFGMNRVVDGVHYPGDVEAGRIDGTLVAAALMANPDFQRDFADAKAEVRAALKLD
ncbi:acid phosphatase [Paraburkholderia sp. MM5482-R2]